MIWKENYRGYNIYWGGKYHVEDCERGHRTIREAREAIDRHILETKPPRPVYDGTALIAYFEGDAVTLITPDGESKMSRREYRHRIYSICDHYDMDVITWTA